jgi:hypothetical protein
MLTGKKSSFLGVLDPEDGGTTIPQNTGNNVLTN